MGADVFCNLPHPAERTSVDPDDAIASLQPGSRCGAVFRDFLDFRAARCEWDCQPFIPSLYAEHDLLIWMLFGIFGDVVRAQNALAVHLHNKVVWLEPGLFGRASLFYFRDHWRITWKVADLAETFARPRTGLRHDRFHFTREDL